MNNRILAIVFSLFVLANNVFADKESDAFLERAAKNTKGERILLGHKAKMGATYTNNEFRMEYTLTYDGKNYVIDFFMRTPLNSPEQGVENMLKPEYKYFLWKKYRHVVKVLRRTKTDILLRARNPITNIFPPYGLSKPEIVKWAKKNSKSKDSI